VGASAAHVIAHGGFRDPELLGDLARALALGEHVRDERRGGRKLRLGAGRQRAVLTGGRVEQAGELVHLQEGSLRLWHTDAHPLAARRVVIDVAVLDCIIEDRRQPVDQLPHRCRPERDGAPAAPVADVGARFDRLADLGCLAQLARLELTADVAVDLVERAVAEERQQVAAEPPAVVARGALGDRLVAEDAVNLGLQPPRGVLVERRRLGGGRRCLERRGRLGPWPHARAHPGLDVPEFGSRARLVPAATAAASASGSLVQDDELAAPACAEAQMERPGAVGEFACFDGAARDRSHQRLAGRGSPGRHAPP
jgi:hypothetical protein